MPVQRTVDYVRLVQQGPEMMHECLDLFEAHLAEMRDYLHAIIVNIDY